jgi:hypothetical protein
MQVTTQKLRFCTRAFLLGMLLCVANTSQAEVNSVFIQSRLDYNAIIITGVDIIFVYEQALLDKFPETKMAWYSGKRRFSEEAGDGIDIVSVFAPQGFDSEMASLPARRNEALKVFVFGQHDASTVAPADITSMENVLVEIDQFGIRVSRRN